MGGEATRLFQREGGRRLSWASVGSVCCCMDRGSQGGKPVIAIEDRYGWTACSGVVVVEWVTETLLDFRCET